MGKACEEAPAGVQVKGDGVCINMVSWRRSISPRSCLEGKTHRTWGSRELLHAHTPIPEMSSVATGIVPQCGCHSN